MIGMYSSNKSNQVDVPISHINFDHSYFAPNYKAMFNTQYSCTLKAWAPIPIHILVIQPTTYIRTFKLTLLCFRIIHLFNQYSWLTTIRWLSKPSNYDRIICLIKEQYKPKNKNTGDTWANINCLNFYRSKGVAQSNSLYFSFLIWC